MEARNTAACSTTAFPPAGSAHSTTTTPARTADTGPAASRTTMHTATPPVTNNAVHCGPRSTLRPMTTSPSRPAAPWAKSRAEVAGPVTWT
ncbi:hypothetical protein GCM10029964_069780 [Kibdelosporangium lantanae]